MVSTRFFVAWLFVVAVVALVVSESFAVLTLLGLGPGSELITSLHLMRVSNAQNMGKIDGRDYSIAIQVFF